jgi:simple sugar transport system ATP-binding protein
MSHSDASHFWKLIQGEVENGLTVVIATHKLEDIKAQCSRVTVMRAGKLIFNRPTTDVSIDDIINGMAPRLNTKPKRHQGVVKEFLGDPIVRISGNGDSLCISEHEVHGIAGLDGSGYHRWLEALALCRQDGLTVHVNDINVDTLSISARRNMGIGYIPADRHSDALISSETLSVNMSFGQLPKKAYEAWLPLRSSHIEAATTEMIMEAFDVRPRDVARTVSTLSGGNQQKFLVGRELERDTTVLVINQPTRGLDRGAADAISGKIKEASLRENSAVLVYSDDLTFLMNTCDKISIVSNGRLRETRPVGMWTETSLVEAII